MHVWTTLAAWLGDAAGGDAPDRKLLLARWLQLMLPFVLGSVLTLIALWALVVLRKRRQRQSELLRGPRTPSTTLADAWAEAGRRAAPPTADELSEVYGLSSAVSGAEGSDVEDTAVAVPSPVRSGATTGGRPVALVTGGARRVGRATALALARAGCDLIVTYRESHEDAGSLARELESLGAAASLHRVDLDDPDAVESFARSIADTTPRLDVLVHNASVFDATPLESLTAEHTLRQFRVNALAPLLISVRLAPLLADSTRRGGGAIVIMGDMHAMGRPRPKFAAYGMSKAAVGELVMQLARELAPTVRVNGVAPGVVAWPESGPDADPGAQAKYLRRVPLGRAGTPDDAAEAVRWLALDAHYVTGQIVRVDGGESVT